MPEFLEKTLAILALVVGFGFVVFWHELGHFLAAKWVGIRIEQFAVGFGQAVCSWRKGWGFSWGSSGKKYSEFVRQAVADGRRHEMLGADAAVGETEYRFNWIPLGGYVKMLGQDDLNPNAQSEDPRAYKKSIGARMLVVSAGVIMNVILAALLFMACFMVGFRVAPPVVGWVQPQSPAQKAGLQVGDRILYFNDTWQHDFTKVQLNTALAPRDEMLPIQVARRNAAGQVEELKFEVQPQRPGQNVTSFMIMGIGSPGSLRGRDPEQAEQFAALGHVFKPEAGLMPGERVVAINDKPVDIHDLKTLDDALQQSAGKPIVLSIADESGQRRRLSIQPELADFFGDQPFHIAGLQPLAKISEIPNESPARGKLREGDIVLEIKSGELKKHPTAAEAAKMLVGLIGTDGKVDLLVWRDGAEQQVADVPAGYVAETSLIGRERRSPSFDLTYAPELPIVAAVLSDTPARAAGVPAPDGKVQPVGIPEGRRIEAIDNQPVSNWFDIRRLLEQSGGSSLVKVEGQEKPLTLTLEESARTHIRNIRYMAPVAFQVSMGEWIAPRKTSNPIEAIGWGTTETRDLLLQAHITIHRMIGPNASVSYKNLMGPVGIFHGGALAAFKGPDWLLWFLAMISANLAVVNFLPIPIVDGGLFLFLIVEKIQGKPLSARTQTVAQLVGIAIIVSVFLLATYQDIARLFL